MHLETVDYHETDLAGGNPSRSNIGNSEANVKSA